MVEKTPNHGLNKYSEGEPSWTHSPDMQTIEERMVVRDVHDNLQNYTPYSTATFIATDTKTVYDGDGSSWQLAARGFETIASNNVNQNRVYDSRGRYHGELTGSKDAKVVIDAIEDRQDSAKIIVPDPGFPLDWEQQVDLPADERGFTLQTLGLPTLSIPSNFSGSAAIRKPSSTANTGIFSYELGGFTIDDTENRALSWGIDLDDIKYSIINPTFFRFTPGIAIRSSNSFSNQNIVFAPRSRSPRGPCVKLEDTSGGARTDQNWVYSPFFMEKSSGENTETAYVDEGNFNSWIFTRVEFAKTAHEFSGRSYYVSEGGWDRDDSMDFTVKEVGGAQGEIRLRAPKVYKKVRLVSPASKIHSIGDTLTGDTYAPPTDVFHQLRSLTTAHTLSAVGLRDDSSGGTAEINPTFFNHPFVRLQTGATSGNTAILDTGERSLKDQAYPKTAVELGYPNSGDLSDVVVRFGFYGDPDNRAELVYDPTNNLGGHDSNNWYFEVVTGGRKRGAIDTGVSPQRNQLLALNRECDQNENDHWTAVLDRNTAKTIAHDGVALGPCRWRLYTETTAATSKTWDLKTKHGATFYRY